MRVLRVLVVVVALILAPITAIPVVRAPVAEDSVSSTTAPDVPLNAPPKVSKTESPGTIKQPFNNTTSYLTIKQNRINTTTMDIVTLDVGGSVVVGTRKLVRSVNAEQFKAAVQNSSNEQAVVHAALNQVANRTADLRARQATVIEAYNNGDLSAQAFLRELAIIAEKASQFRFYIDQVNSRQANKSARDRGNYLKHELATLIGPVRAKIQSALQGNSSAPQRYFIQTSAHGVVLATIDEDVYFRETYLAGARTILNATGINRYEQARRIMEKSYPVASNWSNKEISTNERYGLYRFRYRDYAQRITAYVDGSSGAIFYETQKRNLTESLDDENTLNGTINTSDTYALSTRVTYPGGYMRVRLTERENGTDRNGTISIDGETVGITGDDGNLYILQPREQTTITATVNGTTLSVTVEKASPPTPISAANSGSISNSPFNPRARERDERS